jgi:membrane protein DedA with SNARE-associated domain
VQLPEYLEASVLGTVHWIVLFCYIGSLVHDVNELRALPSWYTLAMFGLALVVVMLVVWFAKRAVNDELADEERAREPDRSA